MRAAYMRYACNGTYMHHTCSIHAAYMQHTCTAHALHMQHACDTHALCQQHACSVQTAYMPARMHFSQCMSVGLEASEEARPDALEEDSAFDPPGSTFEPVLNALLRDVVLRSHQKTLSKSSSKEALIDSMVAAIRGGGTIAIEAITI